MTQTDSLQARMFVGDYSPDARFRLVSEELKYKPKIDYPEGERFQQNFFWNDYETRIAEYDNTHQRVLFFPANAAEVRRRNSYVLGDLLAFEDRLPGLVRVTFDSVMS